MRVGSRTDGSRKTHRVYRLTYAYFNGRIPEGLDVHHKCRNRLCVNPRHLELLDRVANVVDDNVQRRIGVVAEQGEVPF